MNRITPITQGAFNEKERDIYIQSLLAGHYGSYTSPHASGAVTALNRITQLTQTIKSTHSRG